MMSCMTGKPESPDDDQYLVVRLADLNNLPNKCDLRNPHCQVGYDVELLFTVVYS